MNLSRFIIIALFIIGHSNLFGQSHEMINFNILDGLPSSEIYDVIQDDYGYMWFSTDRGLSRYNGYEFENFDKSDGLTDNVVFDFLKRPNGEIWCTTLSGGLFTIKGENPEFQAYKYNHLISQHANSLTITALYISKDGDFFIRFHHRNGYLRISADGMVLNTSEEFNGTPNYSMVLKDDTSDPFFFNYSKSLKDIPAFDSMFVRGENLKKNEAVHFANKKVSVFIGKTLNIKSDQGVKSITPLNDRIISSGKLDENHFWIGYNGSGAEVYSYSGERQRHLLSGKFVSQIYRDPQGSVWICTLNSGVYLERNKNIKILDTGPHINSRVHCIESDSRKNIYFGYYDGSVIERNQQGTFQIITEPEKSAPALICFNPSTSEIVYNANNVLSSIQNGPIFTPVESKFLYCEEQDFIVGNRAALTIRNGAVLTKVFQDKRVRDVISYQGNYILACSDGLIYYHKTDLNANNATTLFKGIRMDKLGLMGDYLIAASTGHGIYILNKNFQIVEHITKRKGLSSNFVSNVFSANDSTLWVSTNAGVNRILYHNEGKLNISILNYNDGLLSNEIWDCHVFNDTVWVATQLGINYFSEEYIDKKSNKNKNHFLRWKNVHVNNMLIQFPTRKKLRYDQNKLTFEFEGIDFHHQIEYRYTLKGLEKKWNYTKNREIVYTSLPPGEYELVVQARTSNESWGMNEIKKQFTIDAPFWEALWFKSLVAIILISIVYLFFRYRILSYNREILREILRQLLKRLKRKEPPFIVIKSNGREVKIQTHTILYVNSSGNYIDIRCEGSVFVTRMKISDFLSEVPDPLEFLRVHKSYIIRLDQVEQKSSQKLIVRGHEIPIGRKYRDEVGKIDF
ncbi:MAG: two-component regulator propeller domain-containing protein [Fluviicola sp.]